MNLTYTDLNLTYGPFFALICTNLQAVGTGRTCHAQNFAVIKKSAPFFPESISLDVKAPLNFHTVPKLKILTALVVWTMHNISFAGITLLASQIYMFKKVYQSQ